jgi:hypothetical protein
LLYPNNRAFVFKLISLQQISLAQAQNLLCLHDNLRRCSPVFEEYSLFSNRAYSGGLGTDRFKFNLRNRSVKAANKQQRKD